MNRRSQNSAKLAEAKSWLTGALVVLLLALSMASAVHREHEENHAGPDSCAACLIAHGGVLADGTTGAAVIASFDCFQLPSFHEARSLSVLDVRLAPGRAPPA